ncbi:hypothetical protein [Terriglobus albidus]|uniref:hypothetical protein n=1 Tax=Terriglobus albidus TaxID=1592106 RepID=UPI0021E04B42|nr:hypothetical protein [Terriglobus albidus]
MLRSSLLATAALLTTAVSAQQPMPPDYRGPQTLIPGIYVTPIPNVPFSANVEIVSHVKLDNGTETIRTTTAKVARLSSGKIRNEQRQMLPATVKVEPALLSAHIYDPQTRKSTFLNPATHIAREIILSQPPRPAPNSVPQSAPSNNPNYREENLGTQEMDGLQLTGIRKVRTIPAQLSTTGKEVAITDEYWYSPVLQIYMLISHKDPRSGEQIVAVRNVDRHEPLQDLFEVPTGYKEVDETPVAVAR